MVIAVLIGLICGTLIGGAIALTIYDLTKH